MGIEAAIIGSAVVGAAAQGFAANEASNAQADAAERGVGEQARQYNQTRADFAPYRESGVRGLNYLNYLLGLDSGAGPAPTREQFTTVTPATRGTYVQPMAGVTGQWTGGTPGSTRFDATGYDKAMAEYNARKEALSAGGDYGSLMRNFTGQDLENEPGYQFGLTQGQNAINQSAIARGNFLSGNTLKELSRYSQDYAGTKYDNAFNRDSANKTRAYNFLTGITNQGMGATANTVQAGTNSANAISDLYGQAGNAAAAGYIGTGNAIANAVNSGTNAYLFNNYLSTLPRTATGNVYRPGSGMPPYANSIAYSG